MPLRRLETRRLRIVDGTVPTELSPALGQVLGADQHLARLGAVARAACVINTVLLHHADEATGTRRLRIVDGIVPTELSSALGEVLGADQHLAGLGAVARADDPVLLHHVDEPRGL